MDIVKVASSSWISKNYYFCGASDTISPKLPHMVTVREVKVLAVLGCLFAGFVAVGGVNPCREWLGGCCVKPWDVACNKICPDKVDDWDIAAAAYKECSTGEEYHCAKDAKTNMFVEACTKPVFCGPGREPQIENGSKVSIVCKNCSDDRYNSKNISSADYFYQCPYKKLTCGEGQIECDIKDGFERLTTNRKCRCDVRKRFRSINGLTCISDEHLLCLDDGMCKPTEDVMLNSSCGPRCPYGYFRNETSDECIFDKRSERNQTVTNSVPDQGNGSVIHPSEAPTTSSTKSVIISPSIKPQENTEPVQNAQIGIIVGSLAGIVFVVIAIVIAFIVWRKLNKPVCSSESSSGASQQDQQMANRGDISPQETNNNEAPERVPLLPNGDQQTANRGDISPQETNKGQQPESVQPLLHPPDDVQESFETFIAGKGFTEDVCNKILDESDLIDLAYALGTNWNLLGPFLHLTSARIEQICADHPLNTLGQITGMLFSWRRNSDSHTFREFLLALFNVKEKITIEWKTIKVWAQKLTGNASGDAGKLTRSSTTSSADQSGDQSSSTNIVQPKNVHKQESEV